MDRSPPNQEPTGIIPVRQDIDVGYDTTREYFVGTDLENIRTSAGTVGTAQMTMVDLYGVNVESGAWSWANSTRGSTSPDHTSIVMAPTGLDTFFNGVATGPGLVHAWGPGTELFDSSPAQIPFMVVSVETEALERGAAILGRDDGLPVAGRYQTYAGEPAGDLLRATSGFTDMITGAGDGGIYQAAATSFRDGIIADLLATVREPSARNAPVCIRHSSALEIVLACDDYATTRRYQAITSLGLSNAAGYSERRIRAAFKEMTGVSPISYMRARALHEVRKEFVSAAATSVADAAFRWGFSELGRFARSYRDQYAELPSETLRTSKVAHLQDPRSHRPQRPNPRDPAPQGRGPYDRSPHPAILSPSQFRR